MALLHESFEAKKFDTRIVERNVARGRIAQADVQKALKELPDDSANAEYVSIDSLAAEDDNQKS